jgi:alanyl-tRNA synthetase
MDEVVIEEIAGKKICVKGIGKLFYEQGLPISMVTEVLKSKGIEVSVLHVADECLKNGWSAKTTNSKLVEDFQDSLDGNLNKSQLEKFCYAAYEEQREMIFNYLFHNREIASNWLRNKL